MAAAATNNTSDANLATSTSTRQSGLYKAGEIRPEKICGVGKSAYICGKCKPNASAAEEVASETAAAKLAADETSIANAVYYWVIIDRLILNAILVISLAVGWAHLISIYSSSAAEFIPDIRAAVRLHSGNTVVSR